MFHHKDKECENHTAHILGTVATLIGVVSLACVAYKKRDKICECIDDLKGHTGHLFTPLLNGAKESAERTKDFAKEKKAELELSFVDNLDKLSNQLDDLSDEAKVKYKKQIEALQRKVNGL